MKFIIILSTILLAGCSSSELSQINQNHGESETIENLGITPAQSNSQSLPATNHSIVLPIHEKLSEKSKEILHEINQNLAFYCMKKRNTYNQEHRCLEFTKKVLESCKKQNTLINKSLLRCIQNNLKKKVI